MRKQSGFTVIELFVVIGILGILAVGGFPLLMGHVQEVRLEQQAHILFDDICSLRDACLAAGTGIGSINFICDGPGGGNPVASFPMVRYEIIYPNNASAPKLFAFRDRQGRYCQELGSHAAAIATDPYPIFDMMASSTNPTICTLEFNGNGLLTYPPTGSMSFPLKHFNVSSNRTLDDSGGSWVFTIYNDTQNSTGRVFLRHIP